MRRLLVPGLALGLLLSPGTSAGIGLAPPTCASDPSFGVRIDEEARATGVLDGIYVDGAVAVPVRLGLSLANLQRPSDLVDRGLVNLDVAGSDGSALTGTLELALPITGTAGEGQTAWLVWVGEEPFQPNASYELEYSFVNDKLSDCPEAQPLSGRMAFSTGERSAAEDLVTPAFVSTTLQPQSYMAPGCCVVPEATSCTNEGKCVACWDSFIRIVGAQATVSPPLPVSYFSVEFSLFAGELPQQIVDLASNYATFAVADSAPEYCFQADLRPRAHLEDVSSISQCLPSQDVLLTWVTPPYSGVPLSACAEPPELPLANDAVMLQAVLGASEEEARSTLQQLLPQPPMSEPVPSPTISEYPPASGGCALGPSSGRSPLAPWLLGLLLLARRRR